MKRIFLLLFCIAFFVDARAQPEIADFASAMRATPVDGNVYVTEAVYRESRFHALKKRVERGGKFRRDDEDEKIGAVIDRAGLVDYTSDTLCLLSACYVPDASVSMMIHTGKGAFDLVHDAEGDYSLRSLEDSYADIPEDEKESDFLLYEILFRWDMDSLIGLIKSSGGLSGSEHVLSATRIILKNNRIVRKDIIHFEPALRWHSQ